MTPPADTRRSSPLRRAVIALVALGLIGVAVWLGVTLLTSNNGENVDFVIVPPEQTQAPLIQLSDEGRLNRSLPRELRTIEGSHLVLRQSAMGTVSLSTAKGPVEVFEDVDGTRWSVLLLEKSTIVSVRTGDRDKGSIRIQVSEDTAPKVALTAKSILTSRSMVRLEYSAQDDFGLQTVSVVLTPFAEDAKAETIALPLAAQTRNVEGVSYLDLRDHALAGQSIALHLEAKDALGQTTQTQSQQIRLLKRRYRSADAAILARQNEKLQKSPRYTNDVALLLRRLAERYGEKLSDTGLTLGFSVAYRQLTGLSLNGPAPRYPIAPADDDIIESAMPLLNDLAARMEDRRLADTQERWQSTVRLFDELLAPGADQRALRAAHWQLRRAVSTHLSALFIDAVRHNRSFLLPIVRREGRPHLPDMIEAALHNIRLDTNHQAWGTARRRLDALQDVVENVQSGLPVSHKSSALYPLHQMSAAIGAVEQLEVALKRTRRAVIDDATGATKIEILAGKIRALDRANRHAEIARAAAALDRASRFLNQAARDEAMTEIKEARAHLIKLANQYMQDRLSSVPGSVPQAGPYQDPARLIKDANYRRMQRLVTLIPMADMEGVKSDLLAALAGMEIIAPDR